MSNYKIKQFILACTAAATLLMSSNSSSVNLIINGSFETGDFTGWVANDMANPFYPLNVRLAGASPGFGLFVSMPTDGAFVSSHGFDGGGPGTIEMYQDVTIPAGFDATLSFDWRAGWDYFTFGALSRTFEILIEDAGSGMPLFSENILTADFTVNPTLLDTGPNSKIINLSSLAGNTVRIKFIANIPQSFTGPAHMQWDNVSLDIVRRDSDLDGILDEDDFCPGTLIPESIARTGLKPNRHALLDNDSTFDTQDPYGGGQGPGNIYTTVQTKGCSCEQIIEAAGLGKGHAMFGCSSGVMDAFIKKLDN